MVRTKDHRRVLAKCGYERVDSGRSPEEKYVLSIGDQDVAWTSCPHGSKELKRGTFHAILRQIHLAVREYGPFVRCQHSHGEYAAILRQKQVLS